MIDSKENLGHNCRGGKQVYKAKALLESRLVLLKVPPEKLFLGRANINSHRIYTN